MVADRNTLATVHNSQDSHPCLRDCVNVDCMSSSGGISFYREVLRSVRSLPRQTQSYYRVVAREKFFAHRDETEQDRVAHIIAKSREDVAWIVNKYANDGVNGEGDAKTAN